MDRKDDLHVTFPEIDAAAQTPAGQTRLKRQLAELAIAQATAAQWADAAETNRRLLELAPDSESENRLAKALWEMGELGDAREHYQKALAIDPTNRIAERNIDRLKVLIVEAGEKTVAAKPGSKAPVSIFVEETGKTGFAHLTNLARPAELAQVNPGDSVELTPEGNRLIAISNGVRIGVVEPRVAARLLKLMADGNKYLAGVTSLGDRDVRLIIREVYQDPRNYGKVSFPTAAKSTDLRPYTKGTLVREDEDLEEDLEDDIEDEEIENLDRVLPPRRPRTRRSSRRRTSSRRRRPPYRDVRTEQEPGAQAPGFVVPDRHPARALVGPLPQSGPMAGRALLLRAEPGFSLPAYERFAPPPPPALRGRAPRDRLGARRYRPRPVRSRRLGRPLRHRPPAHGGHARVDATGPPSCRGRPPPARPAPPRRRRPGDRRVGPSRVQPQGLDHRPLREPLLDVRSRRDP